MQKIYCVEDDPNIRDLIVYALRTAGFEAKGFGRASELYGEMDKALPELILLDIMLPEENGLSVLKTIRADAVMKRIPVIMLTARSAEVDKVRGLDCGADDYITKPFGVMEMIARVKAVLRRTAEKSAERRTAEDRLIRYGGIVLDPEGRSVAADGVKIILTHKEFELLQYLMRHADTVMSRDKLLSAVWGFEFEGESRTVDMHIKTLRQKLGSHGRMIETVRGTGYKFCGEGVSSE